MQIQIFHIKKDNYFYQVSNTYAENTADAGRGAGAGKGLTITGNGQELILGPDEALALRKILNDMQFQDLGGNAVEVEEITPPVGELRDPNLPRHEIYEGWICSHCLGDSYDNDDAIFLSSLSRALCKELDWIKGKRVNVNYWICDEKCTKEQASEDFVKTLTGCAYVDFGARYSEYTGYLWTDEELKVGGHDIMREISSSVGKYLILEIEEVKEKNKEETVVLPVNCPIIQNTSNKKLEKL